MPEQPSETRCFAVGDRLALDPTREIVAGTAMMADPPVLFEMPMVTHLKGSLWLGGVFDTLLLPERFRYVISMHANEAYALSPRTTRFQYSLGDTVAEQSFDDLIPAVLAVEFALGLVGVEQDVLVHCQYGLNRSALVAGIVLVRQGLSGEAAIELMRSTRTPAVLCNARFEAMVRLWPQVGDL